jgi:hypothetical protein
VSKRRRKSISLTSRTYAAIRQHCAETGRSMSDFVETLIADKLGNDIPELAAEAVRRGLAKEAYAGRRGSKVPGRLRSPEPRVKPVRATPPARPEPPRPAPLALSGGDAAPSRVTVAARPGLPRSF